MVETEKLTNAITHPWAMKEEMMASFIGLARASHDSHIYILHTLYAQPMTACVYATTAVFIFLLFSFLFFWGEGGVVVGGCVCVCGGGDSVVIRSLISLDPSVSCFD